ncbi:MAG: carboxylating nicotinate-nucleotide diphosphorylase [Nitrospiraceae bacterium]|nr:MAG: carboxylating nicotinate-nucleotide diphosphorylase [Nitrospiraceae bacterium]
MNSSNVIDNILLNALHEDIGSGDVTTSSLIPENHISRAVIIAKSDFVLAGLPFVERVFHLTDSKIKFRALKKEGGRVKAGDIIARLTGNTANLLMAERTALNLLQRLSGIASLTGNYVKSVKGFSTKIVDTRKTVPGLRYFDKYAVRTGGGRNHRYGLFDGVLIKDNHIAAAEGVGKAVKAARSKAHHLLKIEVEVRNIAGVKEALSAGADIIMLDNMSVDEMKKAVSVIRRRNSGVVIEASGNVTLENVRSIAETGVDLISVGALTHSAPAADISLKIVS